jgi:hypothetical protein
MLRMEQVDFSLMRALMGGSHSKCPLEYYLLELGLLKLRHIIMKRRMVYHHHILTRNENETIKKIYNKQKEAFSKGDWYETLLKDFEFIGEVKNDEIIMKIDKLDYKKIVKRKVEKAAIASYMKRKEEKLTKLDAITYTSFQLQPYFNCLDFGPNEIKILSLLRSKSHPAKTNIKKLHKNTIRCSLGCSSDETQFHIFEECTPILNIIGPGNIVNLNKIYGSLDDQKSIIKLLVRIEDTRIQLIKKIQEK